MRVAEKTRGLAFVLMCGAGLLMTTRMEVAAFLIPGDFDNDADVDGDDYDHFDMCVTGPSIPQNNPACMDALLDADADVDMDDYAFLQGQFSGPGIPADPNGPAVLSSSTVRWRLGSSSPLSPVQGQLRWRASVEVTGDNQGLALFNNVGLSLRNSQGQPVSLAGILSGAWSAYFRVAGTDPLAAPARVLDLPSAGGPGMSYTHGASGGAAFGGMWNPSDMRPGIGREEFKSLLLNDSDDDGDLGDEAYVIMEGVLDVSSLDPNEVYILALSGGTANVLLPQIDLTGNVGAYAAIAGVVEGDALVFTVPEPAALLFFVLAGLAAVRRRRVG